MTPPRNEDLDALRAALERHGIRVDLEVLRRLVVVVAKLPDDERAAARAIVAAVITDEAQRAGARAAAEVWIAARRVTKVDPVPPPPLVYAQPIEELGQQVRRSPRWLWWGLVAAVVLVVSIALAFRLRPGPVVEPPPPDGTVEAKTTEPVEAPPVATRQVTTVALVKVEAEAGRTFDAAILGGVALACLLGAGGWLAFRRRRRPEDDPPPPLGAPRNGAVALGPLLLDPDEQEAVVWGAAQHATEERTERVDAEATVHATARNAGIPKLRYEQRRTPDGVLVLCDQAARPVEVRRLAGEIVETLHHAGLPVQHGDFYEAPTEFFLDGNRYAPEDVDEEVRRARVVVLTDGVGWLQLLRGHAREEQVARVREIAGWSNVHVVCFDPDVLPGLQDQLHPYGIAVLPPENAADALSGVTTPPDPEHLRDLERWAAAIALFPEAATLDLVLVIRQRLGLKVGALDWRVLRSQQRGDVVRFTAEERIDRLGWLYRTTRYDTLDPRFLHDALQGWEQVLARRDGPAPTDPAARVSRALLRVWRDPEAAAIELRAVAAHDEGQKRRIAGELAHLVPADGLRWAGERAVIVLPWRSDAIDAEALAFLEQLGLGAAHAQRDPRLRPPGRRGVALGALAGMVAASAVFLGWGAISDPPAGPPEVVGQVAEVVLAACAGAVCTAGTEDAIVAEPAVAGDRFEVIVGTGSAPCVDGLDGSRVWRCTTGGEAPPPKLWRYVYLRGGDPAERAAVAARLLDRGFAAWVAEVGEFPELVPLQGIQFLFAAVDGAGGDRRVVEVESWSAFARELETARTLERTPADPAWRFTATAVAGCNGDGVCEPGEGETQATCPTDCRPECGDRRCDPGEDCLDDCPTCGDEVCGPLETVDTCGTDCSTCGDGRCTGRETRATCGRDCGVPCGDGACAGGETVASCARDCAVCGDLVCSRPFEDQAGCFFDCDDGVPPRGRQVDAAGLAFVQQQEGLRLTTFTDGLGVRTIGYGYRGPEVRPGLTLTEAQATRLLVHDLEEAGRVVEAAVTVPLNMHEYTALVSLVHDVGPAAFRSAALLVKLNAGDRAGAADAMRLLSGSADRRAAERERFLTPVRGCGNGVQDAGEQCDFGVADNNGAPGGCTPACELPWVWISAGTYTIGTPESETGRFEYEPLPHEVTAPAYAVLSTEVSEAQFRRFGPRVDGDALPKASINWSDAGAWCAAVGGRLPTEAEWEVMARARTPTPWSCGADEGCLGEVAWYRANSGNQPHPVGTKAANGFGVYDVHGNVWEWVEDCYSGDPAVVGRVTTTTEAVAMATCAGRVDRGGGFNYVPRFLRSGNRDWDRPTNAAENLGFRCVRAPARQNLTVAP